MKPWMYYCQFLIDVHWWHFLRNANIEIQLRYMISTFYMSKCHVIPSLMFAQKWLLKDRVCFFSLKWKSHHHTVNMDFQSCLFSGNHYFLRLDELGGVRWSCFARSFRSSKPCKNGVTSRIWFINEVHLSNEKKSCLFRIYMWLYYPVMWGW